MAVFFQTAAGGFVIGIIFARYFGLGTIAIIPLVTAGTALALWALFLLAGRKSFWIISLAAFILLGAANTAYFSDTDTEGHLAKILNEIDYSYDHSIQGYVNAAPDMRERYTLVSMEVYRIVDDSGLAQKVNRGKLYVKVYPSVGKLYHQLNYGQRLEFSNVMVRDPSPAMNPGAFNMRKFLKNMQFEAMVSIRNSDQVSILKDRGGNPLMHAAEGVKSRILKTIKQTVPFPESSFLGGVLLGLRSGLSYEIKDNFRAAGVSHVLAVSGLHVTIITLFFMGLFALFRLPRTSCFLLIVTALVLFTLLTGARPSTMRAAIMNCVTLIFFYYQGLKLDKSFLLGISVSAVVILASNPLVLGEAAFLFSFSAVLSLSLLSRPIHDLLSRYLRGFFNIGLFISALLIIAVCLVSPRLILIQWQWSVMSAGILILCYYLDRRFPRFLEFRRLPIWISMFAAAQLAIQLGMLPLTAFYFKKISIAASLANFLAIPLVGVIVQLGLFAGIIGQIPVIGPYLALCLNAANWIAIKIFLGSATFFGTTFPYPDVSPPKPVFLLFYYSLLLLLASRTWFFLQVMPRFRLLRQRLKKPSLRLRTVSIGVVTILLAANLVAGIFSKPRNLEITFLDPTIFFMGGGNSVHIKTPDNRHYLVDAGPHSTLVKNREIDIGVGEKVITPALLSLDCRHLNGVILSSAKEDYAGGLTSILSNTSLSIDTFYHALPFDSLDGAETSREIISRLEDPALLYDKRRRRSELTAWALKSIFSHTASRKIPVASVKNGDIIHQTTISSGPDPLKFEIRVLNPPEKRFAGKYNSSSNSIVLKITFGEVSVLLTSNMDKGVQTMLMKDSDVRATVLQIPANGASYAQNPDFGAAVNPKAVIVSPPPSRWAKKTTKRLLWEFEDAGILTFRTDTDGAVTLKSDGHNLSATSCASNSTVDIEL